MTTPAGPALEAVRARRSWSKVTDEAPTHAELLTFVSAAGAMTMKVTAAPILRWFGFRTVLLLSLIHI